MEVLTSESEAFFTDLWDRHIKYLESEHNITTPYEYLEYVDRLDDFDDPDGLKEFLEERDIPIDVFFQVAPFHGQEIMYASLNPGMQNNIDQWIFENGYEYGRRIATVGDPEDLAWTVATNMHGYLTDERNQGVRLIIDTMREKLGPLPTDQPLENYVQVNSEMDFKQSYYNDVYLTRVFKYPSLKRKHLNEMDLKWAREPFAQEIEFVSPKLLICGCKDAWMSVYRELVDDPNTDIVPHNDSNVTTNYRNNDPDSATAGVFELPEDDLWVVTVFHEAYRQWIDADRLAENLEYANEQIAWT